jgi:hypothetical protein
LEAIVFYDVDSTWGEVFDCNIVLPTFKLLLDSFWVEVLPEDYIISVDSDGTLCALCLSSDSDDNYWSLGVTFMKDYIIHFDVTQDRIGLYAHDTSLKV